MPSATSTADLMPSSWNPYPHHAPANHTFASPCNDLIAACASMAPASNNGCASVTLCSTVPSRGGRGGLRVTNTSGASRGRFWSRFTQYVTQTLWSSDAVPLPSPFRQFQLAHASRLRGISDASVCRYTSFDWYRTAANAARSAAVAASPSTRKVWSLWAAMTTSSKYPTLSFAFAFAVSLSVFESPPRVSVQVTETAPLAPAACRRTEVTSAFRRTAPAGSAPTTASTYALLLPFTTRHKGRSTMFSRWWFTQNRMSVTMGNAAVSLSEQLQIAAHIGVT